MLNNIRINNNMFYRVFYVIIMIHFIYYFNIHMGELMKSRFSVESDF